MFSPPVFLQRGRLAVAQVSRCDVPSDQWLAAMPRGAYTNARTVSRHSVFELEFHVARLAHSASLMIEGQGERHANAGAQEATSPEGVRRLLLTEVRGSRPDCAGRSPRCLSCSAAKDPQRRPEGPSAGRFLRAAALGAAALIRPWPRS